MAAFLSGLISGGASQASKNKDSKLKGLLRKKKPASAPSASIGDTGERFPGFKRGGRVRRTGLAKVHKGEKVLTKKQAKRMSKKR